MKKADCHFEVEEDIGRAFGSWATALGMEKAEAAQLAMWVLMHLEPAKRQACLDLMRNRGTIGAAESEFLTNVAAGRTDA